MNHAQRHAHTLAAERRAIIEQWSGEGDAEWLREQVRLNPFNHWARHTLHLVTNQTETEIEIGDDEMKADEMHPHNYLRGQDMTGPVFVEIHGIEKVKMPPMKGKSVSEDKWVVYYQQLDKAGKRAMNKTQTYHDDGLALVLRGTLTRQIMSATNTTDTDEWKGKRVVLYPESQVVAGKAVISVMARAPKNGSTPQPEPVATEAAPATMPDDAHIVADPVIEKAIEQGAQVR